MRKPKKNCDMKQRLRVLLLRFCILQTVLSESSVDVVKNLSLSFGRFFLECDEEVVTFNYYF